MPLVALVHRHDAQLRQTGRVLFGTALTYIAYRLLDLSQGYWAVFTVIIVLQGSIASTLSAAADRLIGTIAGALIGGACAVAVGHDEVITGVALTVVVGATAFAAALRPQLRIAPVTAALLLLTQPPGADTVAFVVDRIVEIGLGGVIGVATSVLIFPARSRPLVLARSASALDHIQRILRALAASIEKSEIPALSDEHAALRGTLNAVEQATSDAERERRPDFPTAPRRR